MNWKNRRAQLKYICYNNNSNNNNNNNNCIINKAAGGLAVGVSDCQANSLGVKKTNNQPRNKKVLIYLNESAQDKAKSNSQQ